MRGIMTSDARLSLFERVVYGTVALACVAVVAWVGLLITSHVKADGHTPGAAVPGPIGTPWVNIEDRDQELMVRGAYLSWQVTDGCARGPEECARMLDLVNGEAAAYGLTVFEDGSVSPL